MRVIAIKANEREQCRSNSGNDYRGKPTSWIWKGQQDCQRGGKISAKDQNVEPPFLPTSGSLV
jgi:hypothetical protein